MRRALADICRCSTAVLPRPLGAILPRFCRGSVGVLPVPRGHFAFSSPLSKKPLKTIAAAPRALRRLCGPCATRHRLRTPQHYHHHLHTRRCVLLHSKLLGIDVIAPGPHTPTPRATRAVEKKKRKGKTILAKRLLSPPLKRRVVSLLAATWLLLSHPLTRQKKKIKRQKRCRYVAAAYLRCGNCRGRGGADVGGTYACGGLGNRARFNCRAPTHFRVLLLDGAEVASHFYPTGIASGLCTKHHPLQPTVKMAAAVASAPAQQPQQPQQPAAPAAQPVAATANATPAQAQAQGAVPHSSASLYAGTCYPPSARLPGGRYAVLTQPLSQM